MGQDRLEGELEAFVEDCIGKGVSEAEIRSALLEKNWPKHLIKTVLKRFFWKKPTRDFVPLVELNNVTKWFDEHPALKDINLTIHKGEIFGLIGMSGAGKSTFLHTLVGFEQPDSGEVLFHLSEGEGARAALPTSSGVKARVGFAAQEPSFYDMLTVEENLAHFGALHKVPRHLVASRGYSLMKLLDLVEHKDALAQHLSLGMKKRLDIACALVHKPDLLILDEPTADIDPLLRKGFMSFLEEINREGTTILLSSNLISELEELCDRIGILHNNSLQLLGTPKELVSSYVDDFEIHLELASLKYSFLSKALTKDVLRKLSVKRVTKRKDVLVVLTKKPRQTLTFLLSTIDSHKEKIARINVKKPTLVDVFETIVKK